MKNRSSATTRLHSHLKLSGLAKHDANRVAWTVNNWLSNSGPEWTVKRLKDMKQHVLQRLAGNSSYRPDWVATHKDGTFKGAFRCIARLSAQRQLTVLNAYSAFVLPELSRQQAVKALSSIEGKVNKPARVTDECDSLSRIIGHLRVTPKVRSIFHKYLRYGKFEPASMLTAKPSHQMGSSWVTSFVEGMCVPGVANFLEKKYQFPNHSFGYSLRADDFKAASFGTITCIQERGAKARVVAMPNAAVQTCLRPLHLALNQVLRSLPTDCTFDQEKGAIFARDSLAKGKMVYSVDLSSATDRFPRELQFSVLRHLNAKDELALFEKASKGVWALSEQFEKHVKDRYTFYGAGQPMGLYGSFALFALTHNLLLMAICKELHKPSRECFRVLGDDVIITDDEVHSRYREFLTNVEVQVSESKTIQSNKLAEFAGYVVTSSGYFKVPKVAQKDQKNFVTYLRVFGHAGLKFLPSKVRKIGKFVLELPTELGGLGQNPNGIPLEERLSQYLFTDKAQRISFFDPFTPFLLEARIQYSGLEAETEVIDLLYDLYKKDLGSGKLPKTMQSLSRLPSPPVELYQQLLLSADSSASHPVMKWNTHKGEHRSIGYTSLQYAHPKRDASFRMTDFDSWSLKYANADLS